jgi:hypothetical protein
VNVGDVIACRDVLARLALASADAR